MLDDVSDKEKYKVSAVFAFSVIAAFISGAVLSGSPAESDSLSETELEERVQSLMDQRVQQQEHQLQQVANQSEDLTEEDLSISSEVDDISRSEIGSLYRIDISTTGEVPNQLGNGTRSLDETRTICISSDGRYLFQEPTDLEQPQQQTAQQQPQQPQQPQSPTGDQ